MWIHVERLENISIAIFGLLCLSNVIILFFYFFFSSSQNSISNFEVRRITKLQNSQWLRVSEFFGVSVNSTIRVTQFGKLIQHVVICKISTFYSHKVYFESLAQLYQLSRQFDESILNFDSLISKSSMIIVKLQLDSI